MVKMIKSPVAVVKNEDTEKAVREAARLIYLDKIIKKGSKVLIKPNFCSAASPDSGVVTSIKVVEAVIKEVKKVGGIPIVGESSIGSKKENTEKALEASGVKIAAKDLGVKVVNFDKDKKVEVKIPEGKVLKKIITAKTVLDCDFKVSIPVLKYHPMAKVTLGLKNMKGCLLENYKDRCHILGLHQAIADYNTVLKPDLVVIDGTLAGAWKSGFDDESPVKLNTIVAGFDPVATDAVGCLILGVDPKSVDYLRYASEASLGTLNLEEIEIKGEIVKI